MCVFHLCPQWARSSTGASREQKHIENCHLGFRVPSVIMETYHWEETWNYKQIYEFPQDNGGCILVACTCAPCMFYIHQEASFCSWDGLGGLCCDAWHPRGAVNCINAFIIQELLTRSSHMGFSCHGSRGRCARLPAQTTYGACGRSTTWAASIGCRSGGSSVWPPQTFPSGFILLPVICLTCTAVGGIDCHNGFWNGEVEIPEVWLMQHPCNTDRI